MERADLALRDLGGGRGQIIDMVGDRRAPASRLGCSLADLEQRLGAYEMPQALVERDRREAERRGDGLAERARLLAKDPALLVRGLEETASTWTRGDVERAVATKLGIRDRDADLAATEGAIATATDAVLRASVVIDREAGIYTSDHVREEETAAFAAARTLADAHGAPRIRDPGDELDEQQRAAFAHLATDSQLAIVTGVAGAGKSRLQRALADGYRDAGARVIGVAVAGDAARTLAEEAQIQSRTVAKLINDIDSGREMLGPRDVLLIDEAGTIGTEQARALLETAARSGATVRMLGDESQHEAVARGAVLRGLVEDCGALDMQTTRRAKHEWLRDVATHLRDGRVAPAYDALRDHGCVRAYTTHDEARAHLVQQFIDARAQSVDDDGKARPREAILLADTNADVGAMNVMAQARYRDAGALGEAREYQTSFGATTLHVGDVVAIRAPKSCDAGDRWVNGDRATVVGHIVGGLRLRRERDGALDTWDVHEHSAIQLGYAVTSHRSQGQTVDDAFLLPATGRRGTYVDVTRARDRVTIAYGQDRVSDFGELMWRGQREQRKTLVRDVERALVQGQGQPHGERRKGSLGIER